MLNTSFTAGLSLPAAAGVAVAGAAAATLGWGMFVPQSQLLGRVISQGPRDGRPRIALTFDDGPWPGSTNTILDVLGEAQVVATFFVIGRYAQRWPDLLRRIHDDGHLIGNHTFDHHRLGLFRGVRYWHSQIAQTNDAIASITGQKPIYFRAPMGFKCLPLMLAARRLGHRVIAWSRRGFDGMASTPGRVVSALDDIKPGAIVLLHDGRDPASRRDVTVTARALPAILQNFHVRGLNMVRLDDLIGR